MSQTHRSEHFSWLHNFWSIASLGSIISHSPFSPLPSHFSGNSSSVSKLGSPHSLCPVSKLESQSPNHGSSHSHAALLRRSAPHCLRLKTRPIPDNTEMYASGLCSELPAPGHLALWHLYLEVSQQSQTQWVQTQILDLILQNCCSPAPFLTAQTLFSLTFQYSIHHQVLTTLSPKHKTICFSSPSSSNPSHQNI